MTPQTEEPDEDFELENLGIEIHCPGCGNEMVNDDDTLPLAETPTGAMLECGACGDISEWQISGDPPIAKQVPVKFAGNV